MSRMREDEVCTAVAAWLRAVGFDLQPEFPVLGKVADLYGVNPTTGATIAVECKERDWGRAILQARIYQVAAELVYVALPAASATEAARASLMTQGLGLLVVEEGGATHELIAPRPAGHFTPLLMDKARMRFHRFQTA